MTNPFELRVQAGIKSIQRGTTSATTTSITIAAVNTAKSELRWLGGYTMNGSVAFIGVPLLQLTSATTITQTNPAAASSGGASWELTEWY